MPEPDSIISPIKRAVTWLVWATVALVVSVAVLAGCGLYISNRNTVALCALHDDVQQRITSSQEFLVQHPEGFAGVPAATIRKGISDEQRTVRALSGLSC